MLEQLKLIFRSVCVCVSCLALGFNVSVDSIFLVDYELLPILFASALFIYVHKW